MKNGSGAVLIFFLFNACQNADPQKASLVDASTEPVTSPSVKELGRSPVPISLADAEAVLGEPAYLSDSNFSRGAGNFMQHIVYTAKHKDPVSRRKGVVYYVYEEYTHLDSAKKVYADIKTANEGHGIEVLKDVGDEAYFHTDNENFYFLMARKGSKGFRLKVNKITNKTSKEAFMGVSRKIAAAL